MKVYVLVVVVWFILVEFVWNVGSSVGMSMLLFSVGIVWIMI